MNETIENRANFDIIRYANCWEDADILLKALGSLENKNALSVASAGDNALAMLALKPKHLLALDISLPQLACLEIKKECFRQLDCEQIHQFLGVKESPVKRLDVYREKLRSQLQQQTKEYWDRNSAMIEMGIIHQGKFENYFKLFRNYVLRFIHSGKTIQQILLLESAEAQKEFYDSKWNTFRWRLLFKMFFNRRVMGSAGRDPEFFKYVEEKVATNIFKRVEQAMRYIPGIHNPYLQFIFTGNFFKALPFYLREENYQVIKNNLDALEIFNGSTTAALKKYDQKWDAFNLSDIFEYMPAEIFKSVAAELIEKSNPSATLVYWNMMVPRNIADLFPGKVVCDEKRSAQLFKEDKAFFYQSFHVDKVQ